jgi:hypothetical protein
MTGTLLCILASTATAGEHYVEIWNPPEARAPGLHAPASGKKAHSHHGAKHKLPPAADRTTTRKVAQPAMREPGPNVPNIPNTQYAPGNAAPDRDRTPVIEPQFGPDGNVLQVSYGAGKLH